MESLAALLTDGPHFFINVIESLAEGLIITDEDGNTLYTNGQVGAITGYSHDEFLGRPAHEILLPESERPRMKTRLQERQTGKVEDYELEIHRKDGTHTWIAVHAVPFVDENGRIQGSIGAIRDISARRHLEDENAYLHREFEDTPSSREIIGQSLAIKKVLEQVATVGPTDVAVLITGESGTGKELVTRAVHQHSLRNQRPLIRVNCASIPNELFESEFFGHVRGAFTGAVRDRMGRFDLADGGTLFLDEVGEIPLELQSKLLRVLQENQFEPVGSDRTRSVDVRLVAATNRRLAEEVEQGRFREDLFYRLSVFPIEVPPLRQRLDDIDLLAPHFTQTAAHRLGCPSPTLEPSDLKMLRQYDWPGNVRELQHVIERALIIAQGGPLRFELPGRVAPPAGPLVSDNSKYNEAYDMALEDLPQLEKQILVHHLEKKNWKVYGPGGAAESLAIKPTTLVSKMKKFGLTKPWNTKEPKQKAEE